MSTYRRAFVPGGTYFFTVVTFKRQRFLIEPKSRRILREVIAIVRQQHPFSIDAWVLLPDHMHCIWTLPEGDADFSKRWGLIKAKFSQETREIFFRPELCSQSNLKRRESTVWQRRFWEHYIRNDADYQRHVDYIHYNPVKHGLVTQVAHWPYSTFHRFVKAGLYPDNWGSDLTFADEKYGE